MNIQTLKSCLTEVLPILDANLAAAHEEWMAGDIARGAFEYVRIRHESALAVIRNDYAPEIAYRACALLAIDLRSGVKDIVDKIDKEQAQLKVDAWWQCYRDAGYTEIHRFFGTPRIPSEV